MAIRAVEPGAGPVASGDRQSERLVTAGGAALLDDEDLPSLHLDLDADTDDESEPLDRYGELEVLIDAFVECFNARDLDGLTRLLAPDVELPGLGDDGPEPALVRCWEVRPNAMLSRGFLSDESDTDGWGTQPVAVQWDVDEVGTWQRVALLAFDRDAGPDGGVIGLVEYIGDVALLDEADADPPEHELVTGGSWRQWEEGTD